MHGFRYGAILLGAAIVCLTLAQDGAAQQSYDDESTPEGWAWTLIKQGKEANFDVRCGTPELDPRKDDDRWSDKCRRISATFVADVLTREPWRGQIPPAGVKLAGARIEQDIDLENARLNRVLSIRHSRIEGNITLSRARTDSVLTLDGSRIAGNLSGNQFRTESSLWLRSTEFKKNIQLSYAKIEVNLELTGATLEGQLNLEALQVGRYLLMMRATSKEVVLSEAKIDGVVNMSAATVEGTLNAESLQVGNYLLMNSTHFKKDIILRGAKIGGYLNITNATVEGVFNADSLRLESHLFMRSSDGQQAKFKEIRLAGAHVLGQIVIEGAIVEGRLDASSLQVGAQLFMRSSNDYRATFDQIRLVNAQVAGEVAFNGALLNGDVNAQGLQVGTDLHMSGVTSMGKIDLRYARVTGNLDTLRSTLAELDLAGASVGILTFGDVQNASVITAWKNSKGEAGTLNLRNAHVGNLMDAPSAWPDQGNLSLAGFTFNHLGGLDENSGSALRDRGPFGWDGWLRRDPTYHPSSYEQLAAAFTAAGDRAGADEIRYLSRIRQREVTTDWWPRASSYLFQYTAGFGIGDYTFRVLYWVIGVSLVGGLYLWARVPAARQHGPIWCYGASLSRLLPIIEINKEFTDFFNDPERRRLTGRDSLIFSIIAMVGWLLGAILIAAVSGLVPKG